MESENLDKQAASIKEMQITLTRIQELELCLKTAKDKAWHGWTIISDLDSEVSSELGSALGIVALQAALTCAEKLYAELYKEFIAEGISEKVSPPPADE